MFIEGEIPTNKVKKPRFFQQKTLTHFVYMIMKGGNEQNYRVGQIFNDYEKARKKAINLIRHKNNLLTKKMGFNKDLNFDVFSEVTPDCWTDGKDWIKINAMEIKNS